MIKLPRVAAGAAALLVSVAVFLGMIAGPALATTQLGGPVLINEVVSSQEAISTDEAPIEIEPEPEASPDLTIPSPCRGFTTMGSKELWDSGSVVDPVSKTTITLGTPINWLANPTNSRSWPIYLHGLAWARGYAADYLKTGNIDSLNQAISIVRSHDASVRKSSPAYKAAWKDHPVSLRLTTLACLAAVGPLPSDISKMMNELARWQMDERNYFQRHNHGLMQNISLIRAGCQTGQTRWLNTAWRRMKSDFDFTINSAGVNNEQATGYAFFNWRAWAEALNEIDKCPSIRIPATTLADFQRRLALLELFNTHATQPDGFMVPIGDTLVNRTGLLPNSDLPKTAIYQDGYAFGRSEWQSPDAMHWSLRFGPKANKHGHDDHLAVTYFVNGKRVLVDGAHAGYDRNSDRAYLVSKSAHNTPIAAGFAQVAPKASQLVSNYADENRAVVTVRDKLPTAKSKRLKDKSPLRTRTVVADYPSKLMATLDRAQGERVNVPWTFAPGFSVSADQPGRVTASAEKVNPLPDSISQPALDGADVPPAPLGKPEIYFFNPETCQPLSVSLSQGRSALGWRQLVSSPRVIATGRAVVSLISPDEVSVSCVIDQGVTRLQVLNKAGLTTDFFYSQTQGLR